MPLPEAVYQAIVAERTASVRRGDPPRAWCDRFRAMGVSLDALLNLDWQLAQTDVKRTVHLHKKELSKYGSRFDRGESVVDLARSLRFCSPCLLLKYLLPAHLGWDKADVSAALKDPRSVTDARVRAECEAAVAHDAYYSPHAEQTRRLMGQQKEDELNWALEHLGIPFESEQVLRDRGLPKTPDVRLLSPIGTRLGHAHDDLCVCVCVCVCAIVFWFDRS
jgi:hypothetical protein